MFRADYPSIGIDAENVISNSDAMNIDMMAEIEKELQNDQYDLISLVFILYEVPDTALERLIVFQRVPSNSGSSLLQEWYQYAKQKPTWKHEFVEALLICQLYSIVKKLGLNVHAARKHYQSDNIVVKMYINPMKKALYKLCESVNADNLLKLKKALLSYEIDTTEYDSCELIFLKLLCDKIITINHSNIAGATVNVDQLLKITEHLPGLRKLVLEINMLQKSMNDELKPGTPLTASTPAVHLKVDEIGQSKPVQQYYPDDLEDVFAMLGDLHIDEITNENLKSDRKTLGNDCYKIKSNKRVGVCVIINQENFYPSKKSLEISGQNISLDKRVGSDKDVLVLERTMSMLKFKVISKTDLDHREMENFIMHVIKHEVCDEDSIFMLCILSHGVRGHVYAADSVKVKMDDIQNLLDSDAAVKIHSMPKLLIVQACQVDEASNDNELVADNPKYNCSLKKSNFLIYYATAPDLEAYRNEKRGSIFIQFLCKTIRKFANVEHVFDIFTKVTDIVTLLCTKAGYAQVPIFQSTLRKKLYLQIPQTTDSTEKS